MYVGRKEDVAISKKMAQTKGQKMTCQKNNFIDNLYNNFINLFRGTNHESLCVIKFSPFSDRLNFDLFNFTSLNYNFDYHYKEDLYVRISSDIEDSYTLIFEQGFILKILFNEIITLSNFGINIKLIFFFYLNIIILF